MARYCGNCGTEVDETAVFCPTCGQPIDEAAAAADFPAAPGWPEPGPSPEPAAAEADDAEADAPGDEAVPEAETPASRWGYAAPAAEAPADRQSRAWQRPRETVEDAPTRVEQRPPDEDPSVAPPIPPAPARPTGAPWAERESTDRAQAPGSTPDRPQIELPFTMPVTLSGWLLGIGSALAVLGLIVILITRSLSVIDLLLLVALLGVAATVFLSSRLPALPHLRLISLIVTLIAFGVALDRVAVTGGGAGELLLFMGSAAAAIGAVILELGQDQPLGGPQR